MAERVLERLTLLDLLLGSLLGLLLLDLLALPEVVLERLALLRLLLPELLLLLLGGTALLQLALLVELPLLLEGPALLEIAPLLEPTSAPLIPAPILVAIIRRVRLRIDGRRIKGLLINRRRAVILRIAIRRGRAVAVGL